MKKVRLALALVAVTIGAATPAAADPINQYGGIARCYLSMPAANGMWWGNGSLPCFAAVFLHR